MQRDSNLVPKLPESARSELALLAHGLVAKFNNLVEFIMRIPDEQFYAAELRIPAPMQQRLGWLLAQLQQIAVDIGTLQNAMNRAFIDPTKISQFRSAIQSRDIRKIEETSADLEQSITILRQSLALDTSDVGMEPELSPHRALCINEALQLFKTWLDQEWTLAKGETLSHTFQLHVLPALDRLITMKHYTDRGRLGTTVDRVIEALDLWDSSIRMRAVIVKPRSLAGTVSSESISLTQLEALLSEMHTGCIVACSKSESGVTEKNPSEEECPSAEWEKNAVTAAQLHEFYRRKVPSSESDPPDSTKTIRKELTAAAKKRELTAGPNEPPVFKQGTGGYRGHSLFERSFAISVLSNKAELRSILLQESADIWADFH